MGWLIGRMVTSGAGGRYRHKFNQVARNTFGRVSFRAGRRSSGMRLIPLMGACLRYSDVK